MAKADNTTADDEDDTGATSDEGAGDESGQDQDQTSDSDSDSDNDDNVICTVMCIPDQPGQYRLIKGDEDESGEEGGGSDEDQGTVYKTEGALLKGVLETVRDYEAEKSGEGSAQDNMMAGYGETPEAPMQQKYNE